MTHTRLIAIGGELYFPTSANSDPSTPSLLLRTYPAGDCDTCPWPMDGAEYRERLALALYDERETNPTWGLTPTIIELPDGTVFDFDPIVAGVDHGPDMGGEW